MKIHILILMLFLTAFSTVTDGYGLPAQTAADSSKPLPVVPAVLRSAVLPGWGQIYQERLVAGAFYYGTTATFYYRSFFHLYHFEKKGRAKHHLQKFRSNLSVAVFFHLLNLIDVTDRAVHEQPHGWQGGLLSDKPLRSPWGAVLRSAILPGWGQVYTGSYWKAAAYMAVDGYLLYKVRQADIRYRDTRKTAYRDDRSRYSWYLGLAYLITMADAYVNAYLFRFDDAMRLTLAPVRLNEQTTGITLNVQF